MFNEILPLAYYPEAVLIHAICQFSPHCLVLVKLMFPSLASHADCEAITAYLEANANVVSIYCYPNDDIHILTAEYVTELFKIHPIDNYTIAHAIPE